jgi:hypothetical protein
MNPDANRVGPMDDCSSKLKISHSQVIDIEDSIDSFTQIALNGADLGGTPRAKTQTSWVMVLGSISSLNHEAKTFGSVKCHPG